MSKAAIITAIVLMLLGTGIFVGALAACDFDFSKLSTENYQTNTHQITASFQSIRIDTDTAKITLLPTTDGTCRVECVESNTRHSVVVEDGVLKVSFDNQRKWYDYIGIFTHSQKLTLYIPADIYANLSINSDTGDISIPKDFSFDSISIHATTAHVSCEASASAIDVRLTTGDLKLANLSAGSVTLSSSTGDVKLRGIDCQGDISITRTTGDLTMESVTCGKLSTACDTGDTKLSDVIVTGLLSVKSTTGDVTFNRCDGGEITVTATTGDVTGTLLTGKLFSGKSSTGRVRLPDSTPGGKCTITTSTGNIKITVP